ncbi:MAG: DNA polymerase III subunit delta' [Shewanella sp.]|nr:DNA polymerase III subunit delta' [Shewanella sp.]MCF1430642.1 DNA polymerase III subunit delta' [Shewanella sp.]MCF1437334.1 DNA polymerase III subunit delta' [Shewanella sp.]MCF1456951.1 DNA polymerase III subunit delta' [Shewanella sp.]
MRRSAHLPWLDTLFERVTGLILKDTLSHALLIGVDAAQGGEWLAQDIGAAALCLIPGPAGACGQCKSCHLLQSGNHPDLHQVRADGSQIKIDQIRELCNALTATAQQGGRRVAIIYACERMNQASANALLKTLEEPGKDTLLLLQTQTPARLLPTIASRCQKLAYVAPDRQTICNWLMQQHQVSEDITWVLPVAGGPLVLADSLSNGDYARWLQYRQDWRTSLMSGHLCGSLLDLKQEYIVEALKVLYLVLRSRLIQPGKLDAFALSQIVALADRVMRQCHHLETMASVNYLALCQRFVLEYKQVTQ